MSKPMRNIIHKHSMLHNCVTFVTMKQGQIDGAKLKAARKQHGLTLKEVGIQMGFASENPHSYLSLIETGKKPYYDKSALIRAIQNAYLNKYGKILKTVKI